MNHWRSNATPGVGACMIEEFGGGAGCIDCSGCVTTSWNPPASSRGPLLAVRRFARALPATGVSCCHSLVHRVAL